MKNICASCVGVNVNKIIKTDNSKKPKWLKNIDYVTEFISKIPVKSYKQKKTDTKLTVNLSESRCNKYVLYWGAGASSDIKIKDAKTAYSNFSNYGVTKVDKYGKAVFYFKCPQAYSTVEKGKTKKETFYKHIHFSFSNNINTKWTNPVYTKIIVCDLGMAQTLKLLNNDEIVLINALPAEYYAKSHIPNSYNLHHKTIKKMSQDELLQWFKDVIYKNYKNLAKLIKKNQINLYEVPIVFYCGNKSCNLSEKASQELLKKGFVNIREFSGGMKEYGKYFL